MISPTNYAATIDENSPHGFDTSLRIQATDADESSPNNDITWVLHYTVHPKVKVCRSLLNSYSFSTASLSSPYQHHTTLHHQTTPHHTTSPHHTTPQYITTSHHTTLHHHITLHHTTSPNHTAPHHITKPHRNTPHYFTFPPLDSTLWQEAMTMCWL